MTNQNESTTDAAASPSPSTSTQTSTPTLHVSSPVAVQNSGAPVARSADFPRRGAFCVVAGALAIIASVGRRSTMSFPAPTDDEPDRVVARDVIDTSQPFAEVHLVETREGHKNYGHFQRAPEDFGVGDVQERGGEIFNVPFDAIERAPWSRVRPVVDRRNGKAPAPSEAWARRNGYILDEEQHAAADGQDRAEQQEAERQRKDSQFLATHPDAIALEEQIEGARAAFIADAARRRQALADSLLAQRDGTPS